MKIAEKVPDHCVRDRALNTAQSFIVQAPAGSGKTTLLIQRYLALLAIAPKMPENILAITFTKKAAYEMQTRLLEALKKADHPPEENDNPTTVWLAKKVLKRSSEKNWGLLENPNRLKILTFDGLCRAIVEQMPLSSDFGKAPEIIEDPDICYQRASLELIKTVEEDCPWQTELITLLQHSDNQIEKIKNLLVNLLKRRDQWLSPIMFLSQQKDPIAYLEKMLDRMRQEKLYNLEPYLPKLNQKAFACLEINAWPVFEVCEFKQWQMLSEKILTQKGTVRKPILKKIPEIDDYPEFIKRLIEIQKLPDSVYSTSQKKILKAHIKILPILVACLKIEFKKISKIDFCENALGALLALGNYQDTSELALKLDYKIHHILVDEFQDTSSLQVKLLEMLVKGYQRGDGRTLFLVGDPMQSIYRFRQANVGLFMQAIEKGLGGVCLEFLQLSVNFRSHATLIDWTNELFSTLFPSQADINRGGVPYSKAICFKEKTFKGNLQNHFFLYSDKNTDLETKDILTEIQKIQTNEPNDTIAILVRSKSHLMAIMPALKQANIPFHSVELEPLFDNLIIRDLFTLTTAILHLNDRIAWCGLFRCPLIGLTLKEIYEIQSLNLNGVLLENAFELISTEKKLTEGLKKLKQVLPILEEGIVYTQQRPLSVLVRTLFKNLGGFAFMSPEDLPLIESFFGLLENLENQREIFSANFLENKLNQLFNQSENTDSHALEIMTIHKAKGLEFDHVFLPGLGRRIQSQNQALLLWQETLCLTSHYGLLLAPLPISQKLNCSIYDYLKSEEKKSTDYETSRLLYVAITRAKKQLFLFGHLEKEKPNSGSFLNLLWKKYEQDFLNSQQKNQQQEIQKVCDLEKNNLKRILISKEKIFSEFKILKKESRYIKKTVFFTESFYAQQIGTIVHRYLYERVLNQNLKTFSKKTLRKLLFQAGIFGKKIKFAEKTIQQAIENINNDPKMDWILSNQHTQHHAEWPVSGILQGEYVSGIIDRVFLDQNEIFWIIDYKMHENPEKLHLFKKQVSLYAYLVNNLPNYAQFKIQKALYFILAQKFRVF